MVAETHEELLDVAEQELAVLQGNYYRLLTKAKEFVEGFENMTPQRTVYSTTNVQNFRAVLHKEETT